MGGAQEVDLLTAFAYPLPVAVISDLIGVSAADRVRIRRYADELLATDTDGPEASADPPGPTFTEFLSELVQATAPHVRSELPEDEQPGLLHALLVATEGQDRLTQDEIVNMLATLLLAGHETTANLIGNGMLALLRHPDQRDLLVRRPDLLPNAVEEMLRYDGPAERATMRFTLEAVTIGGVTVPAHQIVSVVIGSADHDPGHFLDPDQLDVARPCPPHVGVGHGIHFCLGAPLARLEAQIAFARILARFPDMVLACPVEDLRFLAAGYMMRGFRSLPVRLHGASSN